MPGRSPQSRAAPALSLPQSSPEPARGAERAAYFAQAEELQELRLVAARAQVQEPGAGGVRELGCGLARKAEAEVVLAGKDPAYFRKALRLIVAQPGEQRGWVAGEHVLERPAPGELEPALRAPELGVSVSPAVRGDYARARGAPVPAPEVEALAVAADAERGDLLGPDAGLFHHAADDLAGALPELLHIPLGVAGPGREHGARHGGGAELAAPGGEERGLGPGPAAIQS